MLSRKAGRTYELRLRCTSGITISLGFIPRFGLLRQGCTSWKDQKDADSFMDRMRAYETIAPFQPRVKFQLGRWLTLFAVIVIIGVDVWLISTQ
jgi:hypothetical protein